MLEKPDLQDDELVRCLLTAYGQRISEVAFLPLGADRDTAVYRLLAETGTSCFLKLRRGAEFEPGIRIPRLLKDQGMAQAIAPIPTIAGGLWTRLEPYTAILYPLVEGHSGFDRPLTDRQWAELGGGLRRLHETVVPDDLVRAIPREAYSPHWCERVAAFQGVATTAFNEPVARRLANFLHGQRDQIAQLVRRSRELGDALRRRPLPYVLCHADIHANNVLVGASGALYIIDWDTLIFAPKERDLMFFGGGVGGVWNTPREKALFYAGYGPTEVDPVALAYYRYARIVEDIAVYCEEIFEGGTALVDRENGANNLIGQFGPRGVVEIACRTDRRLLNGKTPEDLPESGGSTLAR